MFGTVWTFPDALGHVRMHSEAVGSVRTFLDFSDLCEAGGCLDAYGLDGCLGPKHPPAGGCLAE